MGGQIHVSKSLTTLVFSPLGPSTIPTTSTPLPPLLTPALLASYSRPRPLPLLSLPPAEPLPIDPGSDSPLPSTRRIGNLGS